jgi:Protein of unknown function (DUF998)
MPTGGPPRRPDSGHTGLLARSPPCRAHVCDKRIPPLSGKAFDPGGATSSEGDELQPTSYSPVRQTVSVLAGDAATDRWIVTGAVYVIGVCHFATAAGLRALTLRARVGLVVAGLAAIGIAAKPATGKWEQSTASDIHRHPGGSHHGVACTGGPETGTCRNT